MKKTKASKLLIAEDDPSMRDLLQRILIDEGHEIQMAEDGLAAIVLLEEPFDLVLTDMRMPGADGLQVLQFVRRKWPTTPVVVITAFGSIPGAVDAMRLGAFDYLTKPLPDPQTLRDVVSRALEADPRSSKPEIVAEDTVMQQVVKTAQQVAVTDTTVLLLGESGTGKEVIAQTIHACSKRSSASFVAVNCAALNESLLESELFGHEKGAFTGALSKHQGKFEMAHGGTLFLDEIAETSPSLQAKLLRVIQERVFERVGGNESLKVDVRIVTATNRDLQAEVTKGSFRQDLYYRLAVFPITIPPLRERPKDIVPLARHFLKLLSRGPSRTTPELDDGVKQVLLSHDWPGNVRELQNVIERSMVLSGSGPLTVESLGIFPKTKTALGGGTLKEMEKRAIHSALEAEGGNRRRAAKRLGIALRTLQYKIKEYGLAN